MNQLLVGYARVSTEQQDLTAQRNSLAALGVGDDRIYVDHGLTGTNRDRPGLRLALAACNSGDTLVVTKLDRLARSLPDARDILDELTRRNVKLSLGGSVHDPTDPIGRLLFNVLAMVAEFEAGLIRMRTREGMKVAKAKGRLRGKQPKLTVNQARHLLGSATPAPTARPNWPSCSASAVPRCTGPSAAWAQPRFSPRDRSLISPQRRCTSAPSRDDDLVRRDYRRTTSQADRRPDASQRYLCHS